MIKWIFLDIDGVLTDGSVYVDEYGKEIKKIHYYNLDAIFELHSQGYLLVALTAEKSTFTSFLEKRVPWTLFFGGCKDKLSVLLELERDGKLSRDEVVFVGDSRRDILLLQNVALSVCPQNAMSEVKKVCQYILPKNSEEGGLWGLIEIIGDLNADKKTEDKPIIVERFMESVKVFHSICNSVEIINQITEVSERIVDCLSNDGKILIAGNGGSAADAQHIAAEFVGRFKLERTAYNVEALSTNTSILTAVGNDYSFDNIFSRQVEARGREGDLLIGISTSGHSKNIINAMEVANLRGMICVLLTGNSILPENEAGIIDYIIKVPSNNTPRIQEAHIVIGHILAELAEATLVKRSMQQVNLLLI